MEDLHVTITILPLWADSCSQSTRSGAPDGPCFRPRQVGVCPARVLEHVA
jgi:hypothetical protein